LSKEQSENFYRDVRRRVSAIPSVLEVSWSSNMPLWAGSSTGFQLEGHAPKSAADQIRAVALTVDRDYFGVSGISLEAGRTFTELDRDGTLPVAIVNEKLARDFWPSGALGRHIRLPGETVSRQVIGVVRTADYTSWGESQQDAVYTPLAQHFADSMALYVRTAADPRQILSVVEREIHTAGPGILIFGTRTGSEIIDNGLFQAKMGVGLLTIFGLVALGLASIGLYGVLAYSVNQRRREIGLRMALGASRAAVVRLIVAQGMTLVGIGVILGLAASLAAGAALSRMLFGIAATDPLSIALAAALLSTIALLACYLPARRATQVDPLDSLRQA
jgi:predicted permease